VVERATRIVFSAISKTIFNLYKGKWIEELPKVVWSHNTMASSTTGFTPFKLLYSEETMLSKETKHQSLRTMKQALAADEEYSKETIEGTKLEAVENIAKYQEQTRKWRDRQVVKKLIYDGDLVLRRKPKWPILENSSPNGKAHTQRRLLNDRDHFT
jgi:hypothetical protein